MIDRKKATQQVLAISQKYNLPIEPDKKVQDLTVGQKQKLEILKALLRGARILILDEPTAVLTPQETRELFTELKALRDDGYTIIFISHKLGEVRELCDRITIIRRGVTMGVHNIADVTEREISRLMVGRDVILSVEKGPCKPGKVALRVKDLRIRNEEGREVVRGISFAAKKGEILGVAGVEGNGQAELVRALTGLGGFQGGEIEMLGHSIQNMPIHDLRALRVSHIPEDRMTIGLAPTLSLTDNMLADKVDHSAYSKGGILRRKAIRQYGEAMVKEFGILAQNADVTITSLSGGNIQKVVLAREISSEPEIIIADQPTRGVDVGATEFIRKMLVKMRDDGKTVFLISSDLNEILGLSDRLLVMFEGGIAGYFPDTAAVTEEELGRYMLGIAKQTEEQVRGAADE
jgi:simple sugar transport system ATP-binding protein